MAMLELQLRVIRRVPQFALDVALALAIFVVGVLDLALLHPSDIPPHWHAGRAVYALFAVAALAVALRRKKLAAAYALWVLVIVIGTLARSMFVVLSSGVIAELVLVFSVAEQWSTAVAVVVLIGEFALDIVVISAFFSGVGLFLQIWAEAILLPLVWFAGRAARRRKQLIGDLLAQTTELDQEQMRLTRQAVATERRRIAGELHSLVIQGLEQMAAQTASARMELPSDPERAREAVERIEETGRSTLVDMGRVLALMDAADDAAIAPLEAARDWADA